MKHRFNFFNTFAGIVYNTSRYLCQRKQIHKSEAADHCFGICTNTISGMEHQCLKMFEKEYRLACRGVLPYGYDMAATDGWLFNLNSMNQYGYLTKYDSSWTYGLKYWGDYLKSKGMRFGFYFNPLWVPQSCLCAE